MDGVIDVFVNQDIALQVTKTAKLDEALLASLLAKNRYLQGRDGVLPAAAFYFGYP